jgi:hypothetical protein
VPNVLRALSKTGNENGLDDPAKLLETAVMIIKRRDKKRDTRTTAGRELKKLRE